MLTITRCIHSTLTHKTPKPIKLNAKRTRVTNLPHWIAPLCVFARYTRRVFCIVRVKSCGNIFHSVFRRSQPLFIYTHHFNKAKPKWPTKMQRLLFFFFGSSLHSVHNIVHIIIEGCATNGRTGHTTPVSDRDKPLWIWILDRCTTHSCGMRQWKRLKVDLPFILRTVFQLGGMDKN